MYRRRSTLAITAASVGLAATLAACGGSDDAGSDGMSGMSPSASSSAAASMPADVSDQDAAFASNMIVHHREAIEMADMAAANSSNPAIVRLAGDIKAAQGPEIETLSGWLTDWGMKPPADGAQMDHGGTSMPGMMDAAEMEKMGSMKGPEFDEMFLTSMIEHHEGAVTMSQEVLTSGKDAETKAFAQKVIDDQTAEIAEMRKLLG
jgi:uncharacterized protein (DUF305 family)